jgi:hypothetical protein
MESVGTFYGNLVYIMYVHFGICMLRPFGNIAVIW